MNEPLTLTLPFWDVGFDRGAMEDKEKKADTGRSGTGPWVKGKPHGIIYLGWLGL